MDKSTPIAKLKIHHHKIYIERHLSLFGYTTTRQVCSSKRNSLLQLGRTHFWGYPLWRSFSYLFLEFVLLLSGCTSISIGRCELRGATLLGVGSGSEKRNFQKLLFWEHFLYNTYFNMFWCIYIKINMYYAKLARENIDITI